MGHHIASPAKSSSFKDKSALSNERMPLLHRLKTWLQKRKQGKNKQRSKGAKSATNASKVKSTPRFSEDSTYIFKTT
jgi:hypothetical protein